jgi:hypothetical protein
MDTQKKDKVINNTVFGKSSFASLAINKLHIIANLLTN